MIFEIFNAAGAEILATGITGLSTYIIARQQKQKKDFFKDMERFALFWISFFVTLAFGLLLFFFL